MLKKIKTFKLVLIGIIALELLSWIAWSTQDLNQIFFTAILLITLGLAIYKLEWGIYIILAELIMGSKGYLLHWPLGEFSLSLRLGLFLVVFLAFLVWVIRDREIKFFKSKLWKPYTAFIAALAIAVVIGYLNNNELKNIFLDANGYLYLGLIFPLTQGKFKIKELLETIYAGITALISKTLLLLFIFSQKDFFGDVVTAIYKWVRDTGVGEITLMENGFYRIFIQSHIFIVVAFFIFFSIIAIKKYVPVRFAKQNASGEEVKKHEWILFALSLLVIFLGYSRSFWVGTAGILFVALLASVFILKLKWKKILTLGVILALAFVIDYALILGIVNFPMPGNTSISASSLVTERTKDPTQEAAGSSRMELLDPLLDKNLETPVIGSGFGTTVTYKTQDPRALEANPGGNYTTYAFEWGYLDLWLKLGLWGVIIYGWLLYEILKNGYKSFKSTKNPIILGSLFGLLAIMAIHFFTPYLNHPLGLGWIMFCSLYFTQKYSASLASTSDSESRRAVA